MIERETERSEKEEGWIERLMGEEGNLIHRRRMVEKKKKRFKVTKIKDI